MIRSLLTPDIYVVAADHDLTFIDYLSDKVFVLYGVSGAYDVVSMPYSVNEGIKIYLDGLLPSENLRFRD
jgi:ATP-binding cassette subfamily E protein 1